MADNSAALRRARADDSRTKRSRAAEALRLMAEAGEAITFPAVARRADVSVSLIYADKHLAAKLAEARDRQRQAGSDPACRLPSRSLITEHSLRVDRANAKEQIRQLRDENTVLRERLARTLGAEADVASGRASAGLLDELENRATELQVENAALQRRIRDVEREVRELSDSLDAARQANRDLIGELNRVL